MKKISFLLIAVISLFLISGCGNKVETLTCSNTESDSGVEMKQEILMTFKSKKINTVEIKVIANPTTSLMKENWSLVTDSLKGTYSSLYDLEGITVKEDAKDDSYSVSIKADLDKASKDNLSKIGLDDIVGATDTIEEVKKDAEADGFTCK